VSGTASAGLLTAFGKITPVEIVEFDNDAETGEPIAAIILATVNRAVVKCSSLKPAPEPQAPTPARVTEPGLYVTEDGSIYKVQKARESGHLYAKKLNVITGRRLGEDTGIKNFDFVYAPGAMRELKPEQRMTLEQAKAFGIQYGVCCVCGAFLKDAVSVATGIGPVCAGRV